MDIKYHEGSFIKNFHIFSAHKLQVIRVEKEPDKELEYLLVACEDGNIYLWGFETGNYDDLFTTT